MPPLRRGHSFVKRFPRCRFWRWQTRSVKERTLILLRHAKSDWSGEVSDLERPLAERGLRQAPLAGRWLDRNIGRIDLAVVSPAHRARSTWELAEDELAHRPPTRVDSRGYAASADELLEVVRDLPDEARTVVLVVHNPGVADLTELLTGEWVPMPTSTLAVLGLEGPWSAAGEHPAVMLATGRPPEDLPHRHRSRSPAR